MLSSYSPIFLQPCHFILLFLLILNLYYGFLYVSISFLLFFRWWLLILHFSYLCFSLFYLLLFSSVIIIFFSHCFNFLILINLFSTVIRFVSVHSFLFYPNHFSYFLHVSCRFVYSSPFLSFSLLPSIYVYRLTQCFPLSVSLSLSSHPFLPLLLPLNICLISTSFRPPEQPQFRSGLRH